MCGIFGYIGKEKSNVHAMRIMAMDNQSRGKHSTGIYNGERIFKEAVDAETFVKNENFNEYATGKTVLGHTRYATMGAKNAENAHPYRMGNIKSKTTLVGVHNGMLLPKSFKDLSEEFKVKLEVDSQLIFHVLREAKNDFKKVLPKMIGCMALAWTYKGSTFLYKREDRPLYLAVSEEGVFFSSKTQSLNLLGYQNKDIEEHPAHSVSEWVDGKLITLHEVDKPAIVLKDSSRTYNWFKKEHLISFDEKVYDDYIKFEGVGEYDPAEIRRKKHLSRQTSSHSGGSEDGNSFPYGWKRKQWELFYSERKYKGIDEYVNNNEKSIDTLDFSIDDSSVDYEMFQDDFLSIGAIGKTFMKNQAIVQVKVDTRLKDLDVAVRLNAESSSKIKEDLYSLTLENGQKTIILAPKNVGDITHVSATLEVLTKGKSYTKKKIKEINLPPMKLGVSYSVVYELDEEFDVYDEKGNRSSSISNEVEDKEIHGLYKEKGYTRALVKKRLKDGDEFPLFVKSGNKYNYGYNTGVVVQIDSIVGWNAKKDCYDLLARIVSNDNSHSYFKDKRVGYLMSLSEAELEIFVDIYDALSINNWGEWKKLAKQYKDESFSCISDAFPLLKIKKKRDVEDSDEESKPNRAIKDLRELLSLMYSPSSVYCFSENYSYVQDFDLSKIKEIDYYEAKETCDRQISNTEAAIGVLNEYKTDAAAGRLDNDSKASIKSILESVLSFGKKYVDAGVMTYELMLQLQGKQIKKLSHIENVRMSKDSLNRMRKAESNAYDFLKSFAKIDMPLARELSPYIEQNKNATEVLIKSAIWVASGLSSLTLGSTHNHYYQLIGQAIDLCNVIAENLRIEAEYFAREIDDYKKSKESLC